MVEKSITAAIKEARTFVNQPSGRGTSWTLYGPYRLNDLHGPSTSLNYDNYRKAVEGRTIWVAQIAVALMGKPELQDTVCYVAHKDIGLSGITVLHLVRESIKEGPMY